MWGAALQPTDACRLVKLVRSSPSARDTGVLRDQLRLRGGGDRPVGATGGDEEYENDR